MNSLTSFCPSRAALRIRLPVLLLTTLLQRTHALRVAIAAGEIVAASPAGAVLKTLFASAASLGALHSLAGATTLVATAPSPVALTVGQPITPIGFTVTDTINIGSWRLGGTLPPGLKLTSQDGKELTGPGVLDATTPGVDDGYGTVTGGNQMTIPRLIGTPTQPGTYTLTLQAVQPAGLAGLSSKVFDFTINVAAAAQTGTPPAFTTQPAPLSVTAGNAITLTAAASGTPAPTFQWQKDGAPIAGATNATLTIARAQVSDAGAYSVVATNSAGRSTSTPVTVAVANLPPANQAPAIARQPANQTIATGSTVVFAADVTGSPAPALQWRRNGVAVAGATSAYFMISGARASDAGSYSVVATNAAGAVTSTAANLVLSNDPNFGHLTNLSIRTTLSASEPSFTVGTVVGGAGTSGLKPLLVRAVGPSLASFGLPTALADSKLDLFSGDEVVARNDNWNGDPALSAAFARVGAFDFASPSSKDAAIFNPGLTARSYTIDVGAVGGAGGDVIAELYDATPTSAFNAATPRLVNVSLRKQINADDSLTAGFFVGGNTARTVLVRAIGPGLAAFGVQGTMPDPQLALYSGEQLFAANDNWGGDAQLTAAASSVGAFGLADSASKDAIILITLPPGSYTAQVKGAGAGGTTLVEVYEIP